MSSKPGICKKCMYWDKLYGADGEDLNLGFCARYAPKPVALLESEVRFRYTVWPITKENGWCGEYRWNEEFDDLNKIVEDQK